MKNFFNKIKNGYNYVVKPGLRSAKNSLIQSGLLDTKIHALLGGYRKQLCTVFDDNSIISNDISKRKDKIGGLMQAFYHTLLSSSDDTVSLDSLIGRPIYICRNGVDVQVSVQKNQQYGKINPEKKPGVWQYAPFVLRELGGRTYPIGKDKLTTLIAGSKNNFIQSNHIEQSPYVHPSLFQQTVSGYKDMIANIQPAFANAKRKALVSMYMMGLFVHPTLTQETKHQLPNNSRPAVVVDNHTQNIESIQESTEKTVAGLAPTDKNRMEYMGIVDEYVESAYIPLYESAKQGVPLTNQHIIHYQSVFQSLSERLTYHINTYQKDSVGDGSSTLAIIPLQQLVNWLLEQDDLVATVGLITVDGKITTGGETDRAISAILSNSGIDMQYVFSTTNSQKAFAHLQTILNKKISSLQLDEKQHVGGIDYVGTVQDTVKTIMQDTAVIYTIDTLTQAIFSEDTLLSKTAGDTINNRLSPSTDTSLSQDMYKNWPQKYAMGMIAVVLLLLGAAYALRGSKGKKEEQLGESTDTNNNPLGIDRYGKSDDADNSDQKTEEIGDSQSKQFTQREGGDEDKQDSDEDNNSTRDDDLYLEKTSEETKADQESLSSPSPIENKGGEQEDIISIVSENQEEEQGEEKQGSVGYADFTETGDITTLQKLADEGNSIADAIQDDIDGDIHDIDDMDQNIETMDHKTYVAAVIGDSLDEIEEAIVQNTQVSPSNIKDKNDILLKYHDQLQILHTSIMQNDALSVVAEKKLLQRVNSLVLTIFQSVLLVKIDELAESKDTLSMSMVTNILRTKTSQFPILHTGIVSKVLQGYDVSGESMDIQNFLSGVQTSYQEFVVHIDTLLDEYISKRGVQKYSREDLLAMIMETSDGGLVKFANISTIPAKSLLFNSWDAAMIERKIDDIQTYQLEEEQSINDSVISQDFLDEVLQNLDGSFDAKQDQVKKRLYNHYNDQNDQSIKRFVDMGMSAFVAKRILVDTTFFS